MNNEIRLVEEKKKIESNEYSSGHRHHYLTATTAEEAQASRRGKTLRVDGGCKRCLKQGGG